LKEIIFTLKKELHRPVDGRAISPDILVAKSTEEIDSTKIWEGNKQIELAEIFQVVERVEGTSNEILVRVVGDASKIRKIGYRMASGSLVVDGSAGMYLGEEMSGGSIIVAGNAGAWLGTKMTEGQIEVKGNAGDYVGAGYRGTTLGMKGGLILIHGNVGNEAGCWMRNGTIRVKGNAGLFPGIHMGNGTVYVEGDCAGRAGAQMRGGKIIIGRHIPLILPSFTFEGILSKAKIGKEELSGPFYAFSGDLNEDGKGRLSVSVNNNLQLKWYEKYLET